MKIPTEKYFKRNKAGRGGRFGLTFHLGQNSSFQKSWRTLGGWLCPDGHEVALQGTVWSLWGPPRRGRAVVYPWKTRAWNPHLHLSRVTHTKK